MLNILIVEDNEKKVLKIREILGESSYYSDENISIASTINQAKEYLRNHLFDLLLLDIQIPQLTGEQALKDGGINLLRGLKNPKYNLPQHIIGLTAFDESVESALTDFDSNMYQLVKYDETTNEWSSKLLTKVNNIGYSKNQQKKDDSMNFNYDVAFICAVPKIEMESILRMDGGWKVYKAPNDEVTTYYTGVLSKGEKKVSIVAACASQMGMVASATLTTKIISIFKPRYIFMTGITAGVSGKVEIGDAIIVDTSWDYTSGKIENRDGKEILIPDPYPLRLAPRLKQMSINISNKHSMLAEVKGKWMGPKPSSSLNVHVGDVASGGSVIASSSVLDYIKEHVRKVIGVEMESYGVFFAAQNSVNPKPDVLVIKSVCDFADQNKGDDFQSYAAFTSNEIAHHIIMNELDFS